MLPGTKNKIPYYIMFSSIVLCLALGIWWLYLLSKLATLLQTYLPNENATQNIYFMIIAEGSTFFILIVLVLISTFFLLRKEQRKINSLQKFYAIFSHELKTPLTTLQLQIEVLPELVKKNPIDNEKLNTIISRLKKSSVQLKHELEKMLTLSQLELAPSFILESIDLTKFITNWLEQQTDDQRLIKLVLHEKNNTIIRANKSALETIFNNLIRNSHKHAANNQPIQITVEKKSDNFLNVLYQDDGHISNIEKQKLGNLFYKSESSTGSGLGLFIIKQMMQIMNGAVVFNTIDEKLSIRLQFKAES
jgi:signal transduction histidine kinase